MNEAPQAAPAVVEADRQRRQDPVLIIDKDGIRSVVNGDLIIYDDGRGMLGVSVKCQLAYMERERQADLERGAHHTPPR